MMMMMMMMMMMIACITIQSCLVPLIEALCAQIYFRFEISVVLLTEQKFFTNSLVNRARLLRIFHMK